MSEILIRELPAGERPRERLVKYGAKNLSSEDLIAIILKTGTKEYSSRYLAREVLKKVKDVSELKNLNLSSLIKINGIGAVKAIELLAAIELGRRVYSEVNLDNNLKCNSASKVYKYFKSELSGSLQEYFYCLYLDGQKKLIDKKLLIIIITAIISKIIQINAKAFKLNTKKIILHKRLITNCIQ